MNKQIKKLAMLGSLASVVTLSGCSNVVTDHGLDYQDARSSEVELKLPPGRHDVTDKLIIPNEDRIANLDAKGEFEAPRAPKPYLPMAYVSMVLGQYDVTFEIPTNLSQSKLLLSNYFASFSGKTVVFNQVSETELVSAPIQFKEQGTLSKLWNSITRLEPEKYRLTIDFVPRKNATEARIQLIKISEQGESLVDLTLDEASASQMVDAWSHISKDLTTETALLSKQGQKPVLKSRIWTNQDGKLALFLGKEADLASLNNYIRNTSGVHITSETPPELSLVPQDKLARVGDIVDFKVPLGPIGTNEEVVLFKVRRRNLDDVSWTERSYPYDLKRQQEGYFLTIDAGATETPTLTTYRILSLLAK
ncbi:hypothetical protein [Marinomonas atlantica]|uniref:hypothetical protein n=1 Tax=Marinomonas atlantica TaxID=1806668 RepID=UPI0008367E33|nr:hypothetical protein [Marinomonas atlantica]